MLFRLILFPASVVVLLLVGATAVLADEPGTGQVLVPADHVMPGETFPVTGYLLDPGVPVTLRITQGATTMEVGAAAVATDGTLNTNVLLPATFPVGYADLTVASQGAAWTTVILVGERAEGPNARIAGDGAEPLDTRVIAVGVMTFGLMIFALAGLRYLRR